MVRALSSGDLVVNTLALGLVLGLASWLPGCGDAGDPGDASAADGLAGSPDGLGSDASSAPGPCHVDATGPVGDASTDGAGAAADDASGGTDPGGDAAAALDAGPHDASPDEGSGPPDDASSAPPTLAELLAAFDAGDLDADGFAAALASHDGDATPALEGSVDTGILLVTAAGSPHALSGTFTVGADAVMLIAPGACLAMGADARLEVAGRVLALGTAQDAVHVGGEPGAPFDRVLVTGGPSLWRHTAFRHAQRLLSVDNTHATEIRVEACHFDHWTDKGLGFESADGLVVEGCGFALDSADAVGLGEAIRGFRSAAVIARSTFGPMHGYRDAVDLEECSGEHIPLVLENVFEGGQDDAVDLDGCTAWVVRNYIAHFRPPAGSSPSGGVNGGGVTGDRDAFPVIIGNVIDDCYHGIGFKNGAGPVVINNSVTRSHIGLTLYRSDSGKSDPSGVVVNTLFAGNDVDVQLDGKWWPFYDHADGPQASLEISYSRLDEPMAGEGNTTADPAISWVDDGTLPLPTGVVVVGAGRSDGLAALTSLDGAKLLELLERDLRGATRERVGDAFPGIDIGAVATH